MYIIINYLIYLLVKSPLLLLNGPESVLNVPCFSGFHHASPPNIDSRDPNDALLRMLRCHRQEFLQILVMGMRIQQIPWTDPATCWGDYHPSGPRQCTVIFVISILYEDAYSKCLSHWSTLDPFFSVIYSNLFSIIRPLVSKHATILVKL